MVLHRARGGSRNNIGLLLLFSQIVQFGVENIPPVTLALLAGQMAIFMKVFPQYFPSAASVCMSSYLVYEHRDWRRMFLGTFYHAHDMHLYFNMVSLLYKGTMLERKFGSPYFIYLVSVFTALTSMTYVGLGYALRHALQDEGHLLTCAVGFSGVLFAMKVLTTYYTPPGMQYLMGVIPFPSKYIYWAELVLIQLVTPNASFVGHLAGILVGVCYCYGPLQALMDSFFAPGPGLSRQSSFDGRTPPLSPPRFGSRLFGRGSPQSPSPSSSGSRFDNSPFARGNRPDFAAFPPDSQSGGYDRYTGGLSEAEQYQRAMDESRRPTPMPNQSSSASRLYPDLSDLRTRRANFYNQ